MTLEIQSEPTSLPCPKGNCAGKMQVMNTWPAREENFRSAYLECGVCHLRDFRQFPMPERITEPTKVVSPFKFGVVVEHKEHGKGMVVKSGPNFTTVCFAGQQGKETDCFTSELREFYDPKTPLINMTRSGGKRDMHCELCGLEQTRLILAEQLWICAQCKAVCDIGDRVVRGSE